jgi:hypothetical protein
MRPLIKLSFTFALIMNSSVFAADPVTGFYFGVLGELSYATVSNSQFSFATSEGTLTTNAQLQPVGGGGAFSLGYRANSLFRFEGELLFNTNNYKDATIGTCTLVSANIVSPQGNCTNYPVIVNNGLGFNANILGVYALANAYFDILPINSDSNLFPYVGGGAGGAYIRNSAKLQNDKAPPAGATLINVTANSTKTNFAVQGIVGIGYYMDDFATLGLDFRYISTLSTKKNNNTTTSSKNLVGSGSYGVATLNITATFALEKAVKDE